MDAPWWSIHGGVHAEGSPYRRQDRDQRLDDRSPDTLLVCHSHTVFKGSHSQWDAV